MHYGENFWAGVKANLNTVTERAAAPAIAKYTGVLAAADVEEFDDPRRIMQRRSTRARARRSIPENPA